MEKLRPVLDGYDQPYGHLHYCPGCDDMHRLPPPPRWMFNGDLVKPTFTPSFKHILEWGNGDPTEVCHYILTDGVLHYCSDCTHELSGKQVELPPIPDRYESWGRRQDE